MFSWQHLLVLIPTIAATFEGVALAQHSEPGSRASGRAITVPKSWNDASLSDWATPLADVNVAPGNFTEAELDKVPVYELYRSYPAYYPGREPAGYWRWLQTRKPELLINRDALRTEGDWTKAGQRVFREMYMPPPDEQEKLIQLVRSREALERAVVKPFIDGTIPPRWVVTPAGIRIAPAGCQACHSRVIGGGKRVDGIPIVNDPGAVVARLRESLDPSDNSDEGTARVRKEYLRQFGMPWLKDDIHQRFATMSLQDFQELEATLVDVYTRDDGSPFYPVKVPDLIGLRHRKYIDHTATHRHRGIEDLMRYARLITCCFSGGIGPERKFSVAEGPPKYRFSDDLLYALALYIYSLQPLENPNRRTPITARGEEVFRREGCGNCHTPPFYTNEKLTLAYGFKPRADHPSRADIMALSVGTDPGLALGTRKGTGFYKVPSLKGVWYRGRYGHDGSVTSLEEWFNPARLKSDFVPSGWKGYRVSQRAVPGHEFGLRLPQDERDALIRFLKTL